MLVNMPGFNRRSYYNKRVGYRNRRSKYMRRRRNFSGNSYMRGNPLMKNKWLRYAYHGVRYLRGIVNAERNFLDTGFVNGELSSTGSVNCLSLINQGDAVGNMQGISVKADSLDMRLSIEMDSSATTTWVRLIIVVDNDNSGAFPAITDVLTAATMVAHNSLTANPNRFVTLFDRTFTLNNVGESRNIQYQWHKKLNHHIKISGSGGTITQQRSGSIIAIAFSNEATNTPTFTSNFRLRYYDN